MGSLPSIVRSFKAAVTREAGRLKPHHDIIWQRSFYDHIIRDGRDRYFIEQYIALNPIIWHLHRDGREIDGVDAEVLRRELVNRYGLDEYSAETILEHHLR